MKKILTLSLMSVASLMATNEIFDSLQKSSLSQHRSSDFTAEKPASGRSGSSTMEVMIANLTASAVGRVQTNPQSSAYKPAPATSFGAPSFLNPPKAPEKNFPAEMEKSRIHELSEFAFSRVAPYGGMENMPALYGYLNESRAGGVLNTQKLQTIKKMQAEAYDFEAKIRTHQETLKKTEEKRRALNTQAIEIRDGNSENERVLNQLERDEEECVARKEYGTAQKIKEQKEALRAKYYAACEKLNQILREVSTCSENIDRIEAEIVEFHKQFEIQKKFLLNSELFSIEDELLQSERLLSRNLALDFFTLMDRVQRIEFDNIESVPHYIQAVRQMIGAMVKLNADKESLGVFEDCDGLRRSTTTKELEAMKQNFKDHVVIAIQECAFNALADNKYDVDATFVDLLKKFDCDQEKSLYIIRQLALKTKRNDVDAFIQLKDSLEFARHKQRESFDFSKKNQKGSES